MQIYTFAHISICILFEQFIVKRNICYFYRININLLWRVGGRTCYSGLLASQTVDDLFHVNNVKILTKRPCEQKKVAILEMGDVPALK